MPTASLRRCCPESGEKQEFDRRHLATLSNTLPRLLITTKLAKHNFLPAAELFDWTHGLGWMRKGTMENTNGSSFTMSFSRTGLD